MIGERDEIPERDDLYVKQERREFAQNGLENRHETHHEAHRNATA